MNRGEDKSKGGAPKGHGAAYVPPVPPGLLLRRKYLDERGMAQKELAQRLGVSRSTLSDVVNINRGVTARTATRFWEAFGEDPAELLEQQKQYDEWVLHERQSLANGKQLLDPTMPPDQAPPRHRDGEG